MPSPLTLLCLQGNSSHKEVVKQPSGKVLGVFWGSSGEAKGEGRRWEPLMEGKKKAVFSNLTKEFH